jgi:hypothetical protein
MYFVMVSNKQPLNVMDWPFVGHFTKNLKSTCERKNHIVLLTLLDTLQKVTEHRSL